MAVAADKPFFDALLAEGNALWPYILLRCNAHPCGRTDALGPLAGAAYADLEAWLAQLPDSLRAAASGQDAVFFWDFSEHSRKLALLDDPQLSRLAAVAGVTLHAPALARIVERRERASCREALGEALFEYAQTRGQYQTGAAGDIVARLDTDMPLPARCRLHGWRALHWCCQRWPEALRRLFQQRLERLAAGIAVGGDEARDAVLDDAGWQALWRLLKKCLLREVAPAWAPYFTA